MGSKFTKDTSHKNLFTTFMNDLSSEIHDKKTTVPMERLPIIQNVVNALQVEDPVGYSVANFLEMLEVLNIEEIIFEIHEHPLIKATKAPDVFVDMKQRKVVFEAVSSVLKRHLRNRLFSYEGKLYINGSTAYRCLNRFDTFKMVEFLRICLNNYFSADNNQYILSDEIKKHEYQISSLIRCDVDSTNHIIQFKDCYLENAKLYKGPSPEFPRYFINRNVYHAVEHFYKTGEKPKPTKVSKSAFDMLLHLSNYDSVTFDRFIADVSMIFCNNVNLRAKFAKFIQLYGQTGANGKSEFQKLLSRTLGEDNVKMYLAEDFNDQFKIPAIVKSLVAYESESAGKVSSLAAQNIKSLVTGDKLSFREIRSTSSEFTPTVTMFSSTNMMVTSSDKTDAYARRIDWFKIDNKLVKSDAWFDCLRSNETSQFLCEYLLIAMLELLERGKLPEKSQQMIETDTSFQDGNNSADEFVQEFGLENLVGLSVKEVRTKYEDWCVLNAKTELKHKFNQTLEAKYNLVRRKLSKTLIRPLSATMQEMEANNVLQISGWMYAEIKNNGVYVWNESLSDLKLVHYKTGEPFVRSNATKETNVNHLMDDIYRTKFQLINDDVSADNSLIELMTEDDASVENEIGKAIEKENDDLQIKPKESKSKESKSKESKSKESKSKESKSKESKSKESKSKESKSKESKSKESKSKESKSKESKSKESKSKGRQKKSTKTVEGDGSS